MSFNRAALRAPFALKGDCVVDVNTPEFVLLRSFYEKNQPTPLGLFEEFGLTGQFRITDIVVRRVTPLYSQATIKMISVWSKSG